MKSAYLNVVLTVIAGCLVWICARDLPLVQPAQAQTNQANAAGNYPGNVIQCDRHNEDCALRVWVMNLK